MKYYVARLEYNNKTHVLGVFSNKENLYAAAQEYCDELNEDLDTDMICHVFIGEMDKAYNKSIVDGVN